MTKADIVDIIAKGTGLSKIETAAVIDGFFATVIYSLQTGGRVELRGFGTFCLRERKEKHVPNPKTGEMMIIPHRIVPDFKPSPKFKKMVLDTMEKSGKFVSRTDDEQINIFSDFDDIFKSE